VNAPFPQANVEPSEILWNVKPIKELLGYDTAPAAHQPLIRLSVGEELIGLAHGTIKFTERHRTARLACSEAFWNRGLRLVGGISVVLSSSLAN
jgi:hypothetical protein